MNTLQYQSCHSSQYRVWVVVLMCLLLWSLVSPVRSWASTGDAKYLPGHEAERMQLDIGLVVRAVGVTMRGTHEELGPVSFSAEASMVLQAELESFRGFLPPQYDVVSYMLVPPRENAFHLRAVLYFVDTMGRRSAVRGEIEYVEEGGVLFVNKISLHPVPPPQPPRCLLFIVPAELTPSDLLTKHRSHASLLDWLSLNAMMVADGVKLPEGLHRYSLFALTLDRLSHGDKLSIALSDKAAGVTGETGGGVNVDYDGFHAAIVNVKMDISRAGGPFIKLVHKPKNLPGQPKVIGLFSSDLKSHSVSGEVPPVTTSHKGNDPVSSGVGLENYLTPSSDSHVYSYDYRNWNKANWGKYEILGAGWHPQGGEKRAFLKFDLAGLDANSFSSARLKMFHYHTGGGNNRLSLAVYAITKPWQEGTDTYHSGSNENTAAPGEISWINQPLFNPDPIAQFNPGTDTNKFVEVDITPLVMAWLTGKPNYGLVIKPAGRLSGRAVETQYGFYSREHKDIDKRPHLVLSNLGSAVQPGEPSGGLGGNILNADTHDIRIVSATYGGNCGVANGNVTAHIAGQCNGKSACSYTVDHKVIGDPVFGCAKTYSVRYRCNNSPGVIEKSLAAEAGLGDKVVLLECADTSNEGRSTDLGRTWHTSVAGWRGVWTRRGNSNTFAAIWTKAANRVTGVLQVTRRGNIVSVERIQSSDNILCSNIGFIAEDGRTIIGLSRCPFQPPQTYPWSVVIEY